MKRKKHFEKLLVIGTICLLTLLSLQVALGGTPNSELSDSEENPISNTAGTSQYTDCIVIIFGKCDTVQGPQTWLFGVYCPLFKKDIVIQSKGGENESLNVIVRERGGGNFGTWYDHENLKLDLRGTTGILFWAGKSLLIEGNQIFARCKAETAFITD